MDSKLVTKEINSCIKPLLKKNGFDKWTGRTYWRYLNDRINMIDFQSFNSYNADVIGCTTFSFSINLSCFLRYIPSQTEIKYKDSELRPREEQGHFRGGLKKGIIQNELNRQDIWYIDKDGANLIDVMIDCGQQIEKNGIDWFNQFTTKQKVFSILINDSEDMENIFGFGNFNSPLRNEYTAYLAIELGKFDLAIDRFEKLSKYYMNQYQQNKYPYYLDRISIIDKEIERIKN
jgi:hypothetical protein